MDPFYTQLSAFMEDDNYCIFIKITRVLKAKIHAEI